MATVPAIADGAMVSGTVYAQTDGKSPAPLVGAEVVILDHLTSDVVANGATEASGRYSISAPVGSYDIRFEPPGASGLGETTVQGVNLFSDKTVDVVLVPVGTIRLHGILRDGEGHPVPKARIFLGDSTGYQQQETTTNSDGSYSLAVPPGTYLLAVSGSASTPSLPERWQFEAGGIPLSASKELDLQLPPATTFTVQVRGPKGQPVPKAQVRLPYFNRSATLALGVSTNYLESQSEYWLSTNDEGNLTVTVFEGSLPFEGGPADDGKALVIPPVGSGYGSLLFKPPAIERPTTTVITFSQDTQLPSTATFSGVLTDGSGSAMAGRTVDLISANGSVAASGVTAEDGSFSVQAPPARYGLHLPGTPLSANSESGSSPSFEVIDLSNGNVTQDLQLPKAASLQITVVDASNKPVAGASVIEGPAPPEGPTALWPGGPDIWTEWLTAESCTTNTSGVCSVQSFIGATSMLSVAAQNGPHVQTKVQVTSGSATAVVQLPSTATPEQHLLTVARKGTGSDGVSSSPPGISCGGTCSASFDHGTVVTLTEVVKSGTAFLGWTGCDSESEGKCIVTMSEAKEVTASFAHEKPVLTLTKAGPGAGTVKSKPAAINCGSVCSEAKAALYDGALVKLAATPATGSTFAEWSGCDAVVAGECEVTMSKAKSVTATFSGSAATIANPQALTLTKAGSGSGTVTGTGISCAGFCTSTVAIYSGPPKAKTLTLTAKPVPGSELTWSGCDSEPEPLKCKVTMSKAREVTATFEE